MKVFKTALVIMFWQLNVSVEACFTTRKTGFDILYLKKYLRKLININKISKLGRNMT